MPCLTVDPPARVDHVVVAVSAVIRPIRPTDAGLLERAFARLSPESVCRRFLVAKPRLTARELRYLTEVDGRDHVALVAVAPHAPDVLLAVGRFVRLAGEPEVAEAAIVVADELQGRGLGTELGLRLADEARARGIRRFTATLLSDNVAAHRVFAAISERLEARHDGGLEELVADLGELPEAA